MIRRVGDLNFPVMEKSKNHQHSPNKNTSLWSHSAGYTVTLHWQTLQHIWTGVQSNWHSDHLCYKEIILDSNLSVYL